MKFLKYLLITIVSAIALVLIIALFLPKTYKVERSVVILAPQPLIMDHVKSLKKMNEWSPWATMDPHMQIVYGGTDGQVGSSSSWKSKDAGVGSQTITRLTNDSMETSLVFKEPMESSATAYFHTQNEGGGVKITWGMKGENPYPLNFMCLFMDNMLGKEYEKGLAKLKEITEAKAKEPTNQ